MKIHITIAGLAFLLALFHPAGGYAQGRLKIHGIVKNTDGEALSGVSVTVKDSRQGTTTDSAGRFSLNVEKGKIVQFNYVGYLPYAQGITAAGELPVTLEKNDIKMDEVVVIGYGTQSRGVVTGAVSKLVNKNLDEIPSSRLDQALTGKIAGVNIQNVTSEVGADPVVQVRGFNSISANAAPLVVVDGVPVQDGLSFVNPQDVASVEVLKDAASAAVYGSRAANGVIIVTTKSGVADKPNFNFKVYYGRSNPYKLNPIMNFTEYVNKLYKEAAFREQDSSVAANRKNLILETERAAYILENQITGYATDWQEVGLQDAGIYNVQLGLSGGKKEVKYYLSGNYQENKGIMKFSESNRLSLKAKLDANLSRKFKMTFNVNPTIIKTTKPAVNYTDYFRMYSFIPVYHNDFTTAFVHQNTQWAGVLPGDYAQARHFNGLPYAGRMPDGSWWESSGPVDPWSTQNNTPISIADRESIKQYFYRVLTSADLSYEILPRLTLKSSVSGYYNDQTLNDFTQSNAKQDGAVNSAEIYKQQTRDLLWENTLNYNRRIGDHNLTGLLLYSVQQTWLDSINMVGRGFPIEDFSSISQAAQIDQALTNTRKDKTGLISYMGRVLYDYKSKYLFAASMRADGSSNFAPGHKWGYFPSVSVGWQLSREPFMQKIKDISNLKLRWSYGATGNNRIPSFAYQDLLYPANYPFGSGTGTTGLGLSPNGNILANRQITWERTFATNAGIDLGLFNNRLSLTLEYYNAITDKLLYSQATMAFSGSNQFWSNAGKLRNHGFEIEFNASPVKNKNLDWSTGITFAANRNKLLSLGGEAFQYNYGERSEVYAAIVGAPAIQFFGYKTDGVWVSDAEIAAAKAAGQTSALSRYFQAGGLKYVDVNGDNIIDGKDRVPIGTPFPDFTWGFNNTFRYKSFDLYFLFQGSQGGKLVNGDLNYNETKRFNKNVNTDDRWLSPMFPGDGKTPYFTNGENWMLSDYALEDASYVSLRNVILGFTMPKGGFLKRAGLKSLRIYASGDNLLYFMGSSYRGINPEARITSGAYRSPLINGYQRGAFPLMRTYTFGLDINF
ncbi:SusC/RagA family TonB-linked outer membrane protein [Niabella beijingensis]|uniref:SusC/RagA family TonB-linked outer membrane protein n=1 Tax=Niabella beijingensis TaxID=2872700 RepID=UPI001CBFC151|nr:TonB-dependent receptor [Niabella beijingensis]MBZ4188727.1 TonB-dependent receptor [Niabella beijingensis]